MYHFDLKPTWQWFIRIHCRIFKKSYSSSLHSNCIRSVLQFVFSFSSLQGSITLRRWGIYDVASVGSQLLLLLEQKVKHMVLQRKNKREKDKHSD
ncbi:hypothetical protein AAHA92_02711 [Salvia divinorum]|uniref:Uncharacterized protein n=1 Tax=Salvia divinorum TaxID=28513 RepID=A0ABD1IER8_SALDI